MLIYIRHGREAFFLSNITCIHIQRILVTDALILVWPFIARGGIFLLPLLAFLQSMAASPHLRRMTAAPLLQFSYQKSQCLIEIAVCHRFTRVEYLRAF